MSEEIYFDIPVKITNPLEKRIFEAFKIYDHDNHNMVDAREVGSILRSLGCVPTESEIKEIVQQTQFANHAGDIHLSNFMLHLKMLLVLEKMKPSPAESLLKAFNVFDPKNKGYISKDDFVEIMTGVGEELTEDELEKMLKSAVNPFDNNVHYEVYINKLIHEPKDSIYKLAKKYGVTRRSEFKKTKKSKN